MNNINQKSQHQNTNQAHQQANADSNIPKHPQANQPTSEAERQQQLQDAHLEDQDASVKLPEQHKDNEPEHKEIGSMD